MHKKADLKRYLRKFACKERVPKNIKVEVKVEEEAEKINGGF